MPGTPFWWYGLETNHRPTTLTFATATLSYIFNPDSPRPIFASVMAYLLIALILAQILLVFSLQLLAPSPVVGFDHIVQAPGLPAW
jgi:hypothetical protein